MSWRPSTNIYQTNLEKPKWIFRLNNSVKYVNWPSVDCSDSVAAISFRPNHICLRTTIFVACDFATERFTLNGCCTDELIEFFRDSKLVDQVRLNALSEEPPSWAAHFEVRSPRSLSRPRGTFPWAGFTVARKAFVFQSGWLTRTAPAGLPLNDPEGVCRLTVSRKASALRGWWPTKTATKKAVA